jgi:ribonuclease P protein component
MCANQHSAPKKDTWFSKTDENARGTTHPQTKKGKRANSANRLVVLRYSVGKNAVIKRSSEIKSILQTGKYVKTSHFKIAYRPGRNLESRWAILIGKKYGTAVERNRAKRRLREILRRIMPELKSNLDLLMFPRKTGEETPFHLLQEKVYLSLKKEGLLNDASS